MMEAFFGVVGVVTCLLIGVGIIVLVAKGWMAFCEWKYDVDRQLRQASSVEGGLDYCRERVAKLEKEIGEAHSRITSQAEIIDRLAATQTEMQTSMMMVRPVVYGRDDVDGIPARDE